MTSPDGPQPILVFVHVPKTAGDRFLTRPVRYVAVLRHPVERVVSLYRFVRTEPRHPLHGSVKDMKLGSVKGMKLGEFVARGVDADQVENGQTHQIVAAPGRDLGAEGMELAELFGLLRVTAIVNRWWQS